MAAVLLLIPRRHFLGAFLLVLVLMGAIATHLTNHDTISHSIAAPIPSRAGHDHRAVEVADGLARPVRSQRKVEIDTSAHLAPPNASQPAAVE